MVARLTAQSDPSQVKAILSEEVLPPQVAEYEIKAHVIRRVAKPPSPSSAGQWNAEAQRLRARLLAYEGMEVSERSEAGLAWEKMVHVEVGTDERKRLRDALLA